MSFVLPSSFGSDQDELLPFEKAEHLHYVIYVVGWWTYFAAYSHPTGKSTYMNR